MAPLNPASPPFRHSVYGLTVETWTPFPELEPAREGAKVDAVFRLGDVPAELPGCLQRGARFQAAPGRLLVWLDQVARYLVSDGREVVVQPESGALESDLRLFLLCSPMGAVLHQRGFLPLHASAVANAPRGRGPHGEFRRRKVHACRQLPAARLPRPGRRHSRSPLRPGWRALGDARLGCRSLNSARCPHAARVQRRRAGPAPPPGREAGLPIPGGFSRRAAAPWCTSISCGCARRRRSASSG
jgi:hypothetical protein